MRMFLALLLFVPGTLLLANWALLPLGAAMIWCSWWVYERSGLRDSEALAGVVMVLGAIGAFAVAITYVVQRLTAGG